MESIPNEILLQIFRLVLQDPDQNPAFSLGITQVCARWRGLALTTPVLWTCIAFTFPVTPEQFAYADLAFQRFNSQPLSILIDCRDPEWDWDEEGHAFQAWSNMKEITSRLLPYASRWKNVDVLADTWLPIYAFLQLTKNVKSLPCLESFSLSRCNAYFSARGQTFQPLNLAEPVPLFGGTVAENLRRVSLVGVHVQWEQSTTLRNLTTLEFKYHAANVLPTLKQFASLLDGCPKLKQLGILGWGPRLDADPESDIASIVLPSLTKFSFGCVDMEYGARILSLFQLPSLRELYLEDVARTVSPLDPQDSSRLLKWLVASQPTARASFASPDGLPINPIPLQSVQILELQSVSSTKDVFSSFFHCFPRVTNLSVFDVSDEALSALEPYAIDLTRAGRPSVGSGPLIGCACPALKELYCQDSDPNALVTLVAARAVIGSVPAIKNVTLEYARSARPLNTADEYARLEKTRIRVIGSTNIAIEGSESD